MAPYYEVKLQILFISSAARPGSQSLFIVEASPSYHGRGGFYFGLDNVSADLVLNSVQVGQ